MSLGRIALAWAVVAAWLFVWMLVERGLVRLPARSRRREPSRDGWWVAGEALLLTLLAALWFGSLGAGMGWLVFLLVGALREWPLGSVLRVVRIARVLAAGVMLARVMGP